MAEILASTLDGYSVMTADGVELGTLRAVTMDVETGDLEHLRVEPDGPAPDGFDRTEDGLLLVPAGDVEAKSDYVLVSAGDERPTPGGSGRA
jgi:sporulation protein YlmC with PRC-barrel domain